MDGFCAPGRADCVLGGQWGSEAKGAAVAFLTNNLRGSINKRRYNLVTTNASSQAGHTAVHNGRVTVTRHLPTAPLIVPGSMVYLNAGCAIDPDVLEQELKDYDYLNQCSDFFIHPNAAVITADCIAAEGRDDSAQTKIASTRKGVGEAISRKVLRFGMIARDHPFLGRHTAALDLNRLILRERWSALVEIPQGYGLSLNGRFYPHCTSRDCSVMQGLSDAGIHPHLLGKTLLVLRTFPIRVGNIGEYSSGGCYSDQHETTWADLGLTPEITTVTKRVRRVFTWSQSQVSEAMSANRPDAVYLSHADYVDDLQPLIDSIQTAARYADITDLQLYYSKGATTDDVYRHNIGALNDRERERQLQR